VAVEEDEGDYYWSLNFSYLVEIEIFLNDFI
jgi:hypothetical protein